MKTNINTSKELLFHKINSIHNKTNESINNIYKTQQNYTNTEITNKSIIINKLAEIKLKKQEYLLQMEENTKLENEIHKIKGLLNKDPFELKDLLILENEENKLKDKAKEECTKLRKDKEEAIKYLRSHINGYKNLSSMEFQKISSTQIKIEIKGMVKANNNSNNNNNESIVVYIGIENYKYKLIRYSPEYILENSYNNDSNSNSNMNNIKDIAKEFEKMKI